MALLGRRPGVQPRQDESDQLVLQRTLAGSPAQAALADEERLVHLDAPSRASLERRGEAVGVLADDDVALSPGAAGAAPRRRRDGCLHRRPPPSAHPRRARRSPPARGSRSPARRRTPRAARAPARRRSCPRAHRGRETRDRRAPSRVRRASTSRERGPARFIAAMAPVRLTMPQSRPHMRDEPLQLAIDERRAGGRGREVEALLAEPRNDAVVDDDAGLVEHHARSASCRL